MANLQGKLALITGATRGLGRNLALRLWHEGANLFLIARNAADLSALKEHLLTLPGGQHIDYLSLDLSSESAVTAELNTFSALSIDILINNAAMTGPIGPVWENDWGEWQRTVQVNLLSPIALCRTVLPSMIARNEGKIINLSGGGAVGSRPNFSAYAVAKTGLVRFSEILADEVKNHTITVNCIAPGVMKTTMLDDIIAAGSDKVGTKEYQQALDKINSAEDSLMKATELCLFLAKNTQPKISGKLISAVWDPWQNFAAFGTELQNSDIYTLRRILPTDRGKNW